MNTAAAPRTVPALRWRPSRHPQPPAGDSHRLQAGRPQEDPHYGNAGVVESELGIFVPMLTDAGVTSFHVTLANHSSLEDTIPPANHPYFKEQAAS